MFEKFLKRSTWADIAISILFVIIGALLVIMPNQIVSIISTVLGIVFIAMGCLKALEYFTTDPKEDYLLTIALVAVIFGVIVLFCSDAILSVFRLIIGIWIVAMGIMNFQTTLVWKEVKSGYWTLSIILAMIMIMAGIAIIVNGTFTIQVIGVLTMVYAVLDIISRSIFMKKIKYYLDN